jgi:hypothetical protein
MENYIVTFISARKDQNKLKNLLRGLAEKDETFSFISCLNFFSFEDEDKKRIFRRAMWIKETLAKDGTKLNFTMSKLKRY